MKKIYTVRQVAEALGFSTNTVYKYLDEGKIRAMRLGKEGRFRIPESEVVRLLGLKAEKGQIVSPQIQEEEVKTAEIVPGVVEKLDLIKDISVPSLFDWFVATLAIFVGFSYFLFPTYVLDIKAASFAEYIKWIKIGLMIGGFGLLATDIFRPARKFWHHFLHFILGAIFLLLAIFSLQAGHYPRMLGEITPALLLLTTVFFHRSDRVKFIILIDVLAVFSGLIFLLYPQSTGSPAFSSWIMENKLIFGVIWYSMVAFLAFWNYKVFKGYWGTVCFIGCFLVAAGSFSTAFIHLRSNLWEDVVYSVTLGSFVIIFPFWHKFRVITHTSKKQLLLGFFWMIIVFTAGIMLVFYLQESFKNYIFSETQKSLKLAKGIVENYVEESQQAVEGFSQEQELVSLMSSPKKDPERLDKLAKKFYLNSTTLRRIILIDKEGKGLVVYPADETFADIDLSRRDYFQTAKKSKRTSISEVIKPVIPGVPAAVVIAVPVLEENGNFLGVLGGSVDFVKLAQNLNETKFGIGGIFVIADQTKHIIYHPDENMLLEPTGYNKALSLAVDGEGGQIEGYNSLGQLSLQTYAPIEALGWGIVAQQPLERVFEHQSTIFFVIFIITIASGVGSLLAVIYLGKKL